MVGQIETMFTSTIYHNNLNYDIKDFCLEIAKTKNQKNRSGVNSWQSENIINDLPKVFLDKLNFEVEQYKIFLNFQKRVKLDYVWLNINKPGAYNLEHDHPNFFISGVYYVDVPEKSGNIIFKHPCPSIDYSWPNITNVEKYTEFNASQWTLTPQKDKLFLFPSWLKHRVDENRSNKDRISISFNCQIEE